VQCVNVQVVSTFLTGVIEKKYFSPFQLSLQLSIMLMQYVLCIIILNYIFYLTDINSIPRCCSFVTFFFFFVTTVLATTKNVHKHTRNVSDRFYRYILLQMRRRIKAVVLCLQGQDINLNGVFPISKTEVLHNSRYVLY
jgi:hypothetical protein